MSQVKPGWASRSQNQGEPGGARRGHEPGRGNRRKEHPGRARRR